VSGGRRAVLLLAAALVVVGLVGWTLAFMGRVSDEPENVAVVDKTATATVQAEVSRALTQVLSYDYDAPEQMEQAADEFLTGSAREEHRVLFQTLKQRAGDQRLTLTAQVQASAVKELEADSAALLVFVDQSSQRAGDNQASVSAAQLAVSAKKVDGHWKISGLRPL